MPKLGRAGLFVTFEGVEGSGKSTQARALEAHLRRRGTPVVVSREPGGSPLGEELRRILLDHAQAGMLPLTELLLYLASRAEHVSQVVRPGLERGAVVISDRYADASVAYQGGGRGLGWETVDPLNRMATGGVQPDVTFLLDLDPASGLARFSTGGGRQGRDRIESEALDFHRRVRAAYLEAAKREPARFVVIDAGQDPDAIARLVAQRIDELLERRGL
ncbi:MAG: dTMP kinase [Candidatus Eisenbacteria bacterium]|nr:dTMP kinase [Candidatus Eisenbacteria bacterium]